MTIQVNTARCPQNHRCPAIRYCPVNAITQQGNAAPVIDQDLCISCEKCVAVCPTGAMYQAP